jgi:SAM-dependent methyltransferase
MNTFETWFCGSAFWRYLTRRELLPWVLRNVELGEHALELGAGPGAATLELTRLTPRLTSLEYDSKSVRKLRARAGNSNARVVRGDASLLPFANETFSAAIAILMLHHLKSAELQDRAFSEIFRVLRPGGLFLAFEVPDGWTHRVGHIWSTFVPVAPDSVIARLTAAGFSHVAVDLRSSGFRIRALRPGTS